MTDTVLDTPQIQTKENQQLFVNYKGELVPVEVVDFVRDAKVVNGTWGVTEVGETLFLVKAQTPVFRETRRYHNDGNGFLSLYVPGVVFSTDEIWVTRGELSRMSV